MVSAAQGGLGAVLELMPDHAPIGDITDISDFGQQVNDIEVTAHDSSGNAEEYISGVISGGEITLTVNFDATDTSGQMAFVAAVSTGAPRQYVIRLPNSGTNTFTFWGYCKSYKVKSELKGAIKATLVFKLTRYGTYA
jgi:hypothetical protein